MIRCCIAKIVPAHVSILQLHLFNTPIFVIKIESLTPSANIRYQNSIYYYTYNRVIRYLNPFCSASAYEKHVSIRSGKQTTYALFLLKGNAVKDQHRNVTQSTPRLFRRFVQEGAFCFRSPQGKLFLLLPPEVAEAKSLLSRNRHTRRDAYQSQQGMMKNEA
jgi:hypothetical protein